MHVAVTVSAIYSISPTELKAQVSFSDCLSSVRPSVCKLSTFSSSSPEPLPSLAQSSLGRWGFKFVQMKGHALFHGEIITG